MRHTERYEIPASAGTRLVRVSCDICGQDIRGPGHFGILDVQVLMHEGEPFSAGGGEAKTIGFDLCSDCFRSKLVPWITSHRGAEPRVTKRDW